MEFDTRIVTAAPIAELVAERRIHADFQPIVELASGSVVGFEALARGPAGSDLETPAQLFTAAALHGLQPELDRACREIALGEALAGGLGTGDLLFLNVEPSGLGSGGILDRFHEEHLDSVSVVVELTERMLTTRPAEVLAAVRWLRERGCRIALDDVGADPRSLALMPFVAPDVIKLDIAVTQDQLEAHAAARILNAVGAEVERSGTVVVAEGIETREHLERAAALGADLGQGWLLGRPERLGRREPGGHSIELPREPVDDGGSVTPFELARRSRHARRGAYDLVLSLSHQLEDEVESLRGEAILLTNFQRAEHFVAPVRRRYEQLARGAALVAALGVGMEERPGVGIRGADLPPDDDLETEWEVIVVGPHFAGAFVARELEVGAKEDSERQFDYIVTYDRELVLETARILLRKVVRSH